MKILLIELETKGHHVSSYLRSIVESLIEKKQQIFILTTPEIKKYDYFNFFKKNTKIIYTNKIAYPKNKNYISLIKFQFYYYQLIKKKFIEIEKRNKIDFVHINTLDFFDKPLSILGSPFGSTNFSGLYLNPKFYINYKNFFYNLFKKKLYLILFNSILDIKKLSNIFIVDPLCIKFLKKNRKDYKKVTQINDLGSSNKLIKFNYSKKKCRNLLDIEQNSFVILIYGFIRKNKSLNELFEVINFIKSKEKIKILIVGKRDSETRKFIIEKIKKNKDLNSKIINIDKFADDLLEKIVFKASDLTWTGYTKDFYGSSGVFFLSSINQRPVISSNHGSIGWYSKKFKIGASVDLTNKKKLISKLNYLIKNKNKIKYNFDKVNLIHNIYNFGQTITKKII